MARVLYSTIVVGLVIGAFLAGRNEAVAADTSKCWFEQIDGLGCACSDTYCGECEEGACLGTRKICAVKHTHIKYPTGYRYLSLGDVPCFEVYSCVPEFGGACGVNNACVMGSYLSSSQTTFVDESGSGTCP